MTKYTKLRKCDDRMTMELLMTSVYVVEKSFGLLASGTIPKGTPLGVIQMFNLHESRCADLLYDELCDSVAFVHLEGFVVMVEQDNSNVTSVIVVHHSRSHIYEMFRC